MNEYEREIEKLKEPCCREQVSILARLKRWVNFDNIYFKFFYTTVVLGSLVLAFQTDNYIFMLIPFAMTGIPLLIFAILNSLSPDGWRYELLPYCGCSQNLWILSQNMKNSDN